MKSALLLLAIPWAAAAQTPSVSNLSTRAQVGAGGDAIFAGFNVSAGGSKTVLIRAAGPALTAFGVTGTLADPRIELFAGANKIGENDNWGTPVGNAVPVTANTFSLVGAFGFAAGSRDAALIATVAPGSYTAVVSGVGDTTGVALLEVYELGAGSARLTNISTRAQVGTGGNILIPGLVVSSGSGIRRLLIRAAGPSLAALGVAGALGDPTLTVLGSNGATVASNNNWSAPVGVGASTTAVVTQAFTQAGAFAFEPDSRDAALIADFSPGNYTIQVSGVGNTSGVALVEVYDITPSQSVTVGAATLTLESLYGTYRHEPVANNFHVGTISLKPGTGGTPVLQWRNEANVTWNLLPELQRLLLRTDATNPYQNTEGGDFRLDMEEGAVVGFYFLNDFYAREGAPPRLTTIRAGGLVNYISASVARPPEGYGFGYSFYTSLWPMVERPMVGFQIGLPGTWIIPNNEDFTQPLLPPGPGTIRFNSPERAPTFWREVFQTVEGSVGYWTSLHFVESRAPKFRLNGTPDGYAVQIASPGWAWGDEAALNRDRAGLAQLSNRLLIPPDGFTMREDTDGEILGQSWMALPLTPAKTGGAVPIGERSLTLFLNAANFKGPVVFWIPDTWTRLSRTYPVVVGRGHDTRPMLIKGIAMETNTVPYFETATAAGVKYSRIPKMTFPVDGGRLTYLMQDVTAYASGALFDGLKSWVNGGPSVTGRFAANASVKPALTAASFTFRQGATDATRVPITGMETVVQSEIVTTPGSTAFALRWLGTAPAGSFPEYFEQAGMGMRVTTAERVPAETKLTAARFGGAGTGAPYTSPTTGANSWLNPAPRAGPFTVSLTDGSIVTYSWYRFADQPALQGLGWSTEEKERLQSIVEKIHAEWRTTAEFMPPPSRGTLASFDSVMLVTPPAGLEIGFVPIVTRQEAR